ncbi:hypothetical protein FSP39_011680 [Pinctada imbricata]|uniref:Cyclic GMP-AMP synthase n=1 Tax=Pinctada imbricata TaxID=66713 RepID=A0AA88XNC9_PINIB|nr:hypothetical protein FSP39_011680 [Pinctada imbricata]
MAETFVEDVISLISKGLYRTVSDIIGPECIIKLRRQAIDVRDHIVNCDTSFPSLIITSGSTSEGFNFESSDLDLMSVDRNVLVCTESNRYFVQKLQSPSSFFMDNEECSPGFTLLRCLTCDMKNENIFNCLIWKGDEMYLSSKAIRETYGSTSISETHGPCQSENYIGLEGDLAFTLRCPVWPEQAVSFVSRSVDRGWPLFEVLKNICGDGCLFVPVNSKQQSCMEMIDLEWRMSFSLAEKKLIYSMNHCQFLCYGLTKLFLNEILKECPPIHDLLCSYFMKTAVFWEISENPGDWTIQTFLLKFWNVLRRLMKWIRDGYCPNFFVPENNMFYGKICGDNQRKLLSVLSDLYSEGYLCLLRCPSLNGNFTTIIRQPYVAYTLSNNEDEYVPMSRKEMMKLFVVLIFEVYFPYHSFKRIIISLDNTAKINIDSEETLCTVRLRLNLILQGYAEFLLLSVKSPCFKYTRNRKHYHSNKAAERLILRAKTHFCMNYMHYARLTYMAGNYQKTIGILHFIKTRLQSQPYMYSWSPDFDIIMDLRQQGMSYDTFIKSFVVSYVQMGSLTLIQELQLECLAQIQYTGGAPFVIPPLVLINFLLILSYTRLGENHKRYDILQDLQFLLNYDDGYHVFDPTAAISWEILGICQQICGDRQAAFQSYIYVLNHEYNYFKQATLARIFSLYSE